MSISGSENDLRRFARIVDLAHEFDIVHCSHSGSSFLGFLLSNDLIEAIEVCEDSDMSDLNKSKVFDVFLASVNCNKLMMIFMITNANHHL